MYRRLLIVLLGLGLIGLISGCSQSTSQNEQDEYADEFGGYLPTNEEVAFGDPGMTAELTADVTYQDDLLSSPEVDSVIDESEEVGTYALRIFWGSLEYDSTVTEITDWTGSLTVSRGAIIVRRLIRFEKEQDYIEPRTDRSLVEWVSKTTVHYDGIFVNLYIPPPPVDSASIEAAVDPVTVTFDTEPFSITFNVSELAALDTIYHLDDSINSVAFRAVKIYPDACPKGFLEGRWGRDSTGQGVFIGRWISQHGALAGHVKGHWGQDPDGNVKNVFYGKWIDLTGQFQGFLKGEYKPRNTLGQNGSGNMIACRVGGGWLRGYIFNADRSRIGVLRGHYLMPRKDSDGQMGYFQARWKTFCPNVTPENDGIEY